MTDATLPPCPPGPHPTPEQLYKARRGPRTAEDERWLAHAAVCATCSEELLRQEAFDDPEPVSHGHLAAAWERFGRPEARSPKAPVIPITRNLPLAQPVAPSRWPALRRAGLPLAAALVAGTVGLGLWQRSHPAVSPLAVDAKHDVERGGGAPAGDWQPSGLLDAPPTELTFTAPPDGETRRVIVHNESWSYTWTSAPTAGGRVLFPEAERNKLKRGEDYYWTLVGEDGAEAPKFRLR
jgi:hypothetical protein